MRPGRASAADVLLEHRDVPRGLERLDPQGRPEPDVAAAEDRDLRARVTLKRRRVGSVAFDLLEPERAMRHGSCRRYLPATSFSKRGLPRSFAKFGSIFSHAGVTK